MNILIIYGGSSSEKEVSIKTGIAVHNALNGLFESKMLMLSNDYEIVKNHYKKGDIVFNCLHGGYGEDGEIQSFFEKEEIKFIGSGSYACSLAIDKYKSKKIARSLNCKVPYGKIIYNESEINEFDTPFIVKPNNEGSSVGFYEIFNQKDLKIAFKKNKEYSGGLLAEEKINGREITVPILDGSALPIVEIMPANKVYDYNSKYISSNTDYLVPADINNDVYKQILNMSEAIYSKMNCRHYSRIDFILNSEDCPYFLELNTYPGMTDKSLFPKSAASIGLSFQDLIKNLVLLAKD
tara:strand:+ start:5984 stop:6868 length:885 start_codon:yes stop_codon:yes gene_type:complete